MIIGLINFRKTMHMKLIIGISILLTWIIESFLFVWSLQEASRFSLHQVSIIILYILGSITIIYFIGSIIYSNLQQRYKGIVLGLVLGVIGGIPLGFLVMNWFGNYGEGAFAFVYMTPAFFGLLGLIIGYKIGKRKEFLPQ